MRGNERQEIVLIDGKPLSYRVRRHRRARSFKVNVSPRDGVQVVIPWRANYKDVPAVMAKWSPWLAEKANEFDCWQGPHRKLYASGSRVLILGHPRELEISALPTGRSRPKLDLLADSLQMVLPAEDIWDPRSALEAWLRRFARQHLNQRVDFWSNATALRPTKVIIGDRKTRWGSCSSRGTLSFCYRLVMAPPDVVDAVVVHELCHLVHLDHSPRFYALLDKHCPEHRSLGNWLREHHDDLQL